MQWLLLSRENCFPIKTSAPDHFDSNVLFPPSHSVYYCQSQCQATIMAVSQVRQNFHAESEEKINKQINQELYASYVYLSMSAHFDRDVVALPGISKFFKHQSEEEREHAQKLISYLNKRGGTLKLADIKAPARQEWGTTEEAFSHALQLEKDVNESLLNLHLVASNHNDANLADFLESEFLQEQVDSIKQLADLLTNVRRVGEGLGIFVFDKELSSSSS